MESEKTVIGNNSFDILRIVAALSVLVLHFNGNMSVNIPSILSPYTYFNGVTIFFVISGFLIPYSFERSENTKRFLKKRIMRIYPALWISVIISTMFIFTLYEVPSGKNAIVYFITQFTFLRFYTMDWLRGYGVGCPNGALWTIFVEIQYYLFVCIFYPKIKNKKNIYWIITFVISCSLNIIPYMFRKYIPDNLGKLYGQTIFPYLWIFVMVMFIYNNRDKIIPAIVKYYWIIFASYFLCLILNINTDIKIFHFSGKTTLLFSNTISIIEFIYIILVIATAFKIKIKRWKKDFSYPIYLFHMIFINVAVQLKIENIIFAFIFVVVSSLLLSL